MNLLNDIPELDGRNYGKWYQKLEIALAMANIDLAINTQPQEPEKPVRAQNEADTTFTTRQKKYDEAKKLYDNEMAPWADSNRKCLLIIKSSISESIRMAITACPTTAEYLKKNKESVHWLFQDLCCYSCRPANYKEVHWWWNQRSYPRDEPHG